MQNILTTPSTPKSATVNLDQYNVWFTCGVTPSSKPNSKNYPSGSRSKTSQRNSTPKRHKTMRQKLKDCDVIKTSLYLDKNIHAELSNLAASTGMKANDIVICAIIKEIKEYGDIG